MGVKDTCTLLDRERDVFSQFIKRFENLSASAMIRLIGVINNIVTIIIIRSRSNSKKQQLLQQLEYYLKCCQLHDQ